MMFVWMVLNGKLILKYIRRDEWKSTLNEMRVRSGMTEGTSFYRGNSFVVYDRGVQLVIRYRSHDTESTGYLDFDLTESLSQIGG